MPKKVVSVRYELMTITNAVRGAGALAERAEDVGDDEARQLQSAIRGILSLVACRLRDLERAIHGEVDPEQFHAPHNAAGTSSPNPAESDVVLEEWATERRERYARALARPDDERREREKRQAK